MRREAIAFFDAVTNIGKVVRKDGQPDNPSSGTGYLDEVPTTWVDGPTLWVDDTGRKALSIPVREGPDSGVLTIHQRYSDRDDILVTASRDVYDFRLDRVGMEDVLDLVRGFPLSYDYGRGGKQYRLQSSDDLRVHQEKADYMG